MKNLILILRRVAFLYALPAKQRLRYSFLALLISVSILPLDIPEEESYIFELAGMTYDIDAKLLEGIAYAETGHLKEEKRSTVVSKSGALGYMQISPASAEDICPSAAYTTRWRIYFVVLLTCSGYKSIIVKIRTTFVWR